MTSALTIKLGLDGLAQVSAGLNRLTGQLSRGFASIRGVAMGATGALAAFAGVAGMGAAIRAGVAFNSKLENLQVSIAATQRQLRPDAFRTWDAALKTSGSVVDLLKAKARDLRVDFDNTARAFQGFTADATRAGVSLREQVTLITTLAQATRALGLEQTALATEARGLMGSEEARAAVSMKLLGISKAELQDARRRGEIYDFLMGKIGAYAELGEKAARTWERASGDIKEAVTHQLADATRALTRIGTDSFIAMTKALDASGVGDAVNAWILAFEDAWKRGDPGGLVVLTFEAAMEATWGVVRNTTFAFLGSFADDWWKHSLIASLRFGQALVKGLVEAVTWAAQPIAAFATWTLDQLTHAFREAWDGFKVVAADALNWVLEKVEAFAPALSAATLGTIPAVIQTPRFEVDVSAAAKGPQTWAEAMDNAALARANMLQATEAWFVGARDTGRDLLGLKEREAAADGRALSALERLRAATARFRTEKRDAENLDDGGGPRLSDLRKLELGDQEADQKKRLLEITRERQNLEGAFWLTEVEKFASRKQSLADEKSALDAILETLRERVAIETDPAVAEAIRNRIDTYEREAEARERNVAGLGPDPTSWSDQFQATFVDLRNQIGTVQQSAARGFRTVVGGAIDAVASGIRGLIDQTMTWGEALQNIGTGIMNAVIDAIARMFAEWIVGRLLASAVGQAASVEEGATDATAKAPGALMTSISSYGVAGILGLAAVIAGLAALSGAFAEGGRPPAGRPALVGERGPELFIPDRPGTIIPHDQVAAFSAAIEASRGPQIVVVEAPDLDRVAGRLSGAFADGGRPAVGEFALVGERGAELFVPDRPAPFVSPAILGPDASAAAPNGAAPVNNAVNVAMFDSRLDARKWADSREAEVWFVDMARRTANRWRNA